MVYIGKPVEGVSLNGLEYVLDDNGKCMKFQNEQEARYFLSQLGFSNEDIESMGIVFQTVQEIEKIEVSRNTGEKIAEQVSDDASNNLMVVPLHLLIEFVGTIVDTFEDYFWDHHFDQELRDKSGETDVLRESVFLAGDLYDIFTKPLLAIADHETPFSPQQIGDAAVKGFLDALHASGFEGTILDSDSASLNSYAVEACENWREVCENWWEVCQHWRKGGFFVAKESISSSGNVMDADAVSPQFVEAANNKELASLNKIVRFLSSKDISISVRQNMVSVYVPLADSSHYSFSIDRPMTAKDFLKFFSASLRNFDPEEFAFDTYTNRVRQHQDVSLFEVCDQAKDLQKTLRQTSTEMSNLLRHLENSR